MEAQAQFFEWKLKGRRVKLTLKTSWCTGVVQRVCPNRMLVLSDVMTETGSKVIGSKLFPGRDVFNVELVEDTDADLDEVQEPKREDPSEEKMLLQNVKSGDEGVGKFVIIDEFLEKFGPAVMDVNNQSMIGVGANGVELHKHGRLCWLQIATDNKVYLFDLIALGPRAFKNGLSMIMENRKLLKVIHDCRPIAGCLFTQFGVKLTNVFDTQVADVMCFHSETGGFLPDRVTTLPQVLSHYLNVCSTQLSSLQISRSIKKETQMWHKRPCPLPLLKAMALSVMHLKSLRRVQMDCLMMDFMVLVDAHLTSSRYGPDEMKHVDEAHAWMELEGEGSGRVQLRAAALLTLVYKHGRRPPAAPCVCVDAGPHARDSTQLTATMDGHHKDRRMTHLWILTLMILV
ncbi:piRNA biogenesis protein EXD1 isoform X1 [Synchiropus splendidus]|uniref:piRNA biogenesis protein EXD1 isoform X1 n=1 Tax=Synchiropus splendidus TaxID=270530 RepID=UPI00237E2EB7|nr:piRNA biogenesis protein EXD1 isoform X1 [Synchiropus splendidus]